MQEVCELQLPENYRVACGLKSLGRFAYGATDFHELKMDKRFFLDKKQTS